jgi:hypothetical protein
MWVALASMITAVDSLARPMPECHRSRNRSCICSNTPEITQPRTLCRRLTKARIWWAVAVRRSPCTILSSMRQQDLADCNAQSSLADPAQLEQVTDQISFGIGQIGVARWSIFTAMCCCVAIVFGHLGCRVSRRTGIIRAMPCARRARRIMVSYTCTPQRRCNSSAISCKLAWARFVKILRKTAICLGFCAAELSPKLTSVLKSGGCPAVMACAIYRAVACHSYVLDFVCTSKRNASILLKKRAI